jgi:hypothetical protein
VLGQEVLGLRLVDDVIVDEPSNGAPLRAGVAEGVPGRKQLWVLLVELVFESPERPFPPERSGESASCALIADSVSEVGHVLVPHVRRQRLDPDQINLVQVDGMFPVQPAVLGP